MYKIAESPRIKDIEERFRYPIETLFYNWHWKENLKHRDIGEKISVPRSTVTKWFQCFGVPSQPATRFANLNFAEHRRWLHENKKPKTRKPFPWHFNKDFFKTWSSEMAYVLGFLVSDGYVFTNPNGSRYFGFVSADREIIKKIRNILGSNHKIGVRKRSSTNPKWRDVYTLQIGNKSIFHYLNTLGIIQNKSLVIKFPKNIPDKFLRHFVRGYFDGDGCVYFGQHWRKDRNKLIWVFQVRFISGNSKFLKELKAALKKFSIVGGYLYKKQRGYELAFSQADGFKLFDAMYRGVPKEAFLERKYKIFTKAIKVLNYNMGP